MGTLAGTRHPDTRVLAEVDVHAGDGRQDRLDDGSRAGVVAGEEGLRRAPDMLGRIVRIRLADASRRLGERLRVRDDAWGWRRGFQPQAPLIACARNRSTNVARTTAPANRSMTCRQR